MNKGDILIYPRSLTPIEKYYVEEIYENVEDEWMAIVSYIDYSSETGWGKVCYPVEDYLHGMKTGHIKIIGNENHIIHKSIKNHHFNVTPRDLPMKRNWNEINPYKESHLYNWE